MILILSITKIIIFVLLGLLVAAFISSNTDTTNLSLFPLPYEITLPLFVVALSMLFLGLLLGGFIVYLGQLKKTFLLKRDIRKSKKNMQAMENEIRALRLEHAPPVVIPQDNHLHL